MADHHPSAGGESISRGSLTVLFEDPFWIGLFEMADREGLRVCKVSFGAEPSEREIMEFIDRNPYRLQYSRSVDASDSLKVVSDDVIKLGYRLKIYDAYRPRNTENFIKENHFRVHGQCPGNGYTLLLPAG